MAVTQLNIRDWLKLLCILIFVFGVVVPCVLLMTVGTSLDGTDTSFQRRRVSSRTHERKPLDFLEAHESADALKFQINELENIRVSVRNELRVMDRDRQRLAGEVESGRESLARVKKEIEKAKTELQNTKSKLSRAARQVKRAADSPPYTNPPAPIVVVNLPSAEHSIQSKPDSVPSLQNQKKRTFCVSDACLDFSICPLHQPFLVYVYNEHRPYTSLFPLKHHHLLDQLLSNLKGMGALTDDPKLACVFTLIVGPLTYQLSHDSLEEKVHSLPQWSSTAGANHVLIDLPHPNSNTLLRDTELGRAIVIDGVAPNIPQQEHNILLPPVTLDNSEPPWQGLPLHLPARRLYLIYFEGQQSQGGDHHQALSELNIIARTLNDKVKEKLLIETYCSTVAAGFEHAFPGEWIPCGSAEQRRSQLTLTTFSLVVGSGTGGLSGTVTYTRLVEALRYGAIPVVVGVGRLPLDSVIDWRLAAIIIPTSQLGQLHLLLKSFSDDSILSFRRQGRFLWETYFSSAGHMLISVMSVVRSRFHHPPPAARDHTSVSQLVALPGGNRQIPSPKFQHNFTVYSSEVWNSPPGPFYMYPSTPFQAAPVSGSQYIGLDSQQLRKLPQHVIQAGGITGPYFEDYLLGNMPEEQFTIVMLTYERNSVLLQALERLSDLDGLSKVVVVWNNPTPPPANMQWPDIGAPLEVCGPHVWLYSLTVLLCYFYRW